LDAQSSVVLNSAGTEYDAMSGGLVSRWALNGSSLGSVSLSGFGSQNSENTYPADRGLAAAGGYWLTYSNGFLSAWDASGNRVDQTTLVGAGTTFDSHLSFSYTNGMAFVVDTSNSWWRGYDIGLKGPVIPEPASMAIWAAGGLCAAGAAALRRRRTLRTATRRARWSEENRNAILAVIHVDRG
jgi:hypothetical protein